MRITEPRRVLSFVSGTPWAIESGKAQEIIDLLNLRIKGGEITEEEMQEVTARQGDRIAPQGGSVAVLPLFGVLAPRMDSMTRFSGGTSLEGFADRFDEAMANDEVRAIVIHVDSPGGSVQGTHELATRIFEARGKKKIIASVEGTIASAAYWVACNADEIVISPSGVAGAIGVFAIHTEVSKAEAEAGITRTIVKAGKFKAEGNPHEPLSEDAERHMQAMIDENYGRFVEAVARARGVNEKQVRTGMGQGAVLAAEAAKSVGLVDRIGTLEQVLGELGVQRSALRGTRSSDDSVDLAAAAVAATDLIDIDDTVLTLGALAALEAPDEPEAMLLKVTETENSEPTDVDGDASAVEAFTSETTAPSGQEDSVKKETPAAQDDGAQDGSEATLTVVHAGVDRAAEKQRIDDLIAMGVAHDIGDRIQGFIDSGVTAEQAGKIVQAEADANLKAMQATGVELTDGEVRRYSITRAIMAVAEKGEGWSGFERDVSDQIASDLPKDHESHGGIFVPVRRAAVASDYVGRRDSYLGRLQALVQQQAMPIIARARLLSQIDQMQAALDSGTATAGQELMFTEDGDFIDLLRARMKVAQLGATILTGLQGNVAFPKQDGAGTFSWVAEDPGSDLADSDLTLTQVALNSATGMSTTAYSRQLLAQGVVDVDNLVKNDLAMITALGIDLAGIAGTGAGNQPTGILNTAGIGDVAIGANGGNPTYAHMVDLESDVATANADIGSMAYLTTPGIRGRLKKTEEFGGSNGRPVWTGGMEGELNGYPADVSTQVPSNLTKGTETAAHAVLFGVWSQLLIGYWGAYELVVDPYSLKKQALIELTSYQQAGLALRHPASFSATQDATV